MLIQSAPRNPHHSRNTDELCPFMIHWYQVHCVLVSTRVLYSHGSDIPGHQTNPRSPINLVVPPFHLAGVRPLLCLLIPGRERQESNRPWLESHALEIGAASLLGVLFLSSCACASGSASGPSCSYLPLVMQEKRYVTLWCVAFVSSWSCRRASSPNGCNSGLCRWRVFFILYSLSHSFQISSGISQLFHS